MVEHEFLTLYHQLAVFDQGLDNPFNDWTQAHIDQGFAWRPGSVSFSTFNDGPAIVRIGAGKTLQVPDDAVRAIAVPFEVKPCGIEIATITQSVALDLDPGKYLLLFAAIPGEADIYHVTFIPSEEPTARILRLDAELNPPADLLMAAEPAV